MFCWPLGVHPTYFPSIPKHRLSQSERLEKPRQKTGYDREKVDVRQEHHLTSPLQQIREALIDLTEALNFLFSTFSDRLVAWIEVCISAAFYVASFFIEGVDKNVEKETEDEKQHDLTQWRNQSHALDLRRKALGNIVSRNPLHPATLQASSNPIIESVAQNPTQLSGQKKTLMGLPNELLINILEALSGLSLRHLVNFRLVSRLCAQLVDVALFNLFPLASFKDIREMYHFLRPQSLNPFLCPAWVKFFYANVFPKAIQKAIQTDDAFELRRSLELKQLLGPLLGLSEEARTLERLVNLGLLNQAQAERLASHPGHARAIKSEQNILQLAQGVQPDWDAFLAVPEACLAGGILAVLRNLETVGQDVLLMMVRSQLFINRAESAFYWTPLHCMVAAGSLTRVTFLMAAAADKEVRDVNGKTPLHYAALFDRTEIAEYLIEQQVRVNVQDGGGRTALHYAVSKKNAVLTRALMTAGAKVDLPDYEGQTPLHYAVSASVGNREITVILLRAGAAINQQNKKGWAALHYAVNAENPLLTRLLLANRATVDLPDHEGFTALHHSALNGNVEITEMLLAHGADATLQNKAHQNALYFAKLAKHKKIVQLLRLPQPGRPTPTLSWTDTLIFHLA